MIWQEDSGGKFHFLTIIHQKMPKKGQKWSFLADWGPPTVHPLPLNIISDYGYLISINPHEMAKEKRR